MQLEELSERQSALKVDIDRRKKWKDEVAKQAEEAENQAEEANKRKDEVAKHAEEVENTRQNGVEFQLLLASVPHALSSGPRIFSAPQAHLHAGWLLAGRVISCLEPNNGMQVLIEFRLGLQLYGPNEFFLVSAQGFRRLHNLLLFSWPQLYAMEMHMV